MRTKQQAADDLGVSTRAIERYTAKGKLNPTYDRDESGRLVALYDESELARVREEMEHFTPQRAAQQRAKPQAKKQSQALTVRGAEKSGALAQLVAAIEAARAQAKPQAALGEKLMLSLVEASALSGLSVGHLRAAIHAKKLKSKIIGHGWKIKRGDLDAYVRKL